MLDGLGFAPGGSRARRRRVLRRLAHAAQPRARADVPVGPAAPRRADQPPRSRRDRLAGGLAPRLSAARSLLVSHDREFLDAVAATIVSFENAQRSAATPATTRRSRPQRAERLANEQALFARQQREIARLEAFIDRFRAKATKARQAQSRLKALERMELIAPAHVDSPFDFHFREFSGQPRPGARPGRRRRRLRRRARCSRTSSSRSRPARASVCSAATARARRRSSSSPRGCSRRSRARAGKARGCASATSRSTRSRCCARTRSPLQHLRRLDRATREQALARLPRQLRFLRRHGARAGRRVLRRRARAPRARARGLAAAEPAAARRADEPPRPRHAGGGGARAAGVRGRDGARLARPPPAADRDRHADGRRRRARWRRSMATWTTIATGSRHGARPPGRARRAGRRAAARSGRKPRRGRRAPGPASRSRTG